MRRVKVGDVLELQRRQVDVEPEVEYSEIGVRSFGKGLFHKEPVTGIELGNKRVFEIHPGDLVFSNVFAWEGAVGLASGQDAGRIGSHRFMTYIARNAEEADVSYLRHYFTSERGVELLGIASPGSAGRNRTLAVERFEAIEIPLPDIDKQRRIAAHLDLVSKKTDRASVLLARSEHLRLAGRSSFLRPDLDVQGGQSGWARRPMSELVSLDLDVIDAFSETSFRLVGVLGFGRGIIDRGEMLAGDTKYKVLHRVRGGQVVMSRLKAWEGALAVVPDELDGAVASPEFPTFSVRAGVNLEFVQSLVRDPGLWSSLADSSKGVGARRERVSAERFLSAEVWVPDAATQKSVGRALRSLQAVEDRGARRAKILEAVFPAALNRAFAGLA